MIPSLLGLGVIALGLILLRYALMGSFWALPKIVPAGTGAGAPGFG